MATLDGGSAALDGAQNAARRRVVVAWHQNLLRWGRLALAIGFITALGAEALNVLFGFVVASALVCLSQVLFLVRLLAVTRESRLRLHWAATWQFTRSILLFSLPFMTWGIFGWAQTASERWSLQLFWTSGQVGRYAVLQQIGYTPVIMMGNMLLQLMAPIVFEKVGDNSERSRRRVASRHLLQAVAIVGALTVGLVLVAAPEGGSTLYGPVHT